MHPSLVQSFQVLEKYFEPCIIVNQNILGFKESWDKVLALIPDDEIKLELDTQWKLKSYSSLEKWNHLKATISSLKKKKPLLQNTIRDIIFQYSYPRMDEHVSTSINHLLKSPFCVHPKTGNVCVAIDAMKCDEFDPFNVPKLDLIVNGVDDGKFKECVRVFEEYLERVERDEREEIKKEKAIEDAKSMLF